MIVKRYHKAKICFWIGQSTYDTLTLKIVYLDTTYNIYLIIMYNTLVIKYLCASTSVTPVPTQGCANETI